MEQLTESQITRFKNSIAEELESAGFRLKQTVLITFKQYTHESWLDSISASFRDNIPKTHIFSVKLKAGPDFCSVIDDSKVNQIIKQHLSSLHPRDRSRSNWTHATVARYLPRFALHALLNQRILIRGHLNGFIKPEDGEEFFEEVEDLIERITLNRVSKQTYTYVWEKDDGPPDIDIAGQGVEGHRGDLFASWVRYIDFHGPVS